MDDFTSWKLLSHQNMGATRALAKFIVELRTRDIPGETQAVIRKALIDAIGCGLYGLTTPWSRIIRNYASEQGGLPKVGLWGTGQRVSVEQSVLSSGTAIHSFDFDDHSRAKIHPGAIVVPVALAMAEVHKVSGTVLMAAITAGYETMNRVSQAANPSRTRMRGWHLTGTCGTFAAAACASVILGLDEETTASALGLAGTQSAGLWAFTADGSMSKRIHPGRAAQAGVTAAYLAKSGFEGPRQILEAEDGSFLFAMSDTPRPERITEHLGTLWHSDATCFKPHACCGSNHACVDAAITLMNAHHLDASDVASVIAGIPSVVKTQTGFEYKADSVLNAQMSLSYNIAVAIFDRQVYLEQFTNERIIDPQVLALVKKIQIEIDPEIDRAYPEIYGGKVDIITRDGKRYSCKVNYSLGMPENPMSLEDIERKFMSLATAAVGSERAANILTLAKNVFDAESVDSLNAMLTKSL